MNSFFSPVSQLFKKSVHRVYFDHAGATPISTVSEAALVNALSTYGNPSAIHQEGVEAGLLLDKARKNCAEVLNAHAYEIYFASSGTESCNMAVVGTHQGWKNDQDGDTVPHIIVSAIEHPAVLEPVARLEKKGLIRVTYLPVYEDGAVKIKDIREALCEETILISVMYANNEIGTLQPVKEIGRLIEEWKKEHGRTHTEYPYFHIDACQAANYCNLDVVRLRAHMMTVNSSKCYGPKGAALLYKREGIRVSEIVYGGGQERGLRSGTESTPVLYAFSVALKEAKELREKEAWRLQLLNDFCREELKKEIPSIIFYGAFDDVKHIPKKENGEEQYDMRQDAMKEHTGGRMMKRLPNNINCRVPGISSEEMILRLDAKGFAVSHKSACASRETDGSYVIEALGKDKKEALENVRITFGRDTRKNDIAKLVKAMKETASKYTK